MMPLRWLLVLDRCPTGDEFEYMYELKVYEVDSATARDQPIAILHTADDLVDMLFTYSRPHDSGAMTVVSPH
ncbi:MAG TPA: hypothetical protein VFT66_09635 [Roseiflexaceae bacterium]|nr:hypothetical protein [Roseiflexaceae bacterium]